MYNCHFYTYTRIQSQSPEPKKSENVPAPLHCQIHNNGGGCRNLDILVWVKDSQGRTFDSLDTVAVDWRVSDTSLGTLAQPSGVLAQV